VHEPEPLLESSRNPQLRELDWRFLLRGREVPRIRDLTASGGPPGLGLVTQPAADAPGAADLALIGYPTAAALRRARRALRPGGALVCLWRRPSPAGASRARRRIEKAGFAEVSLHWPGPAPRRPEFWLPLDSPAAIEHVLGQRPPDSRAKAALRPLWRGLARAGMLAPLCAAARAPAGPGEHDAGDELESLLPARSSWALLTGGKRSINKVIGLPFAEGSSKPALVVKFARVPEAEAGLEREAEVLRALEHERPHVSGIPRPRGLDRRCGRLALAQTVVEGQPLLPVLVPERFEEIALRVTRWLLELAGDGSPQPSAGWWPRVVGAPLEQFERSFEGALGRERVARARTLLEGIGDLPQVPEHRDCSVWNVVLTDGGAPALVDWESAEPHGLPALDLVYFLAMAAFVLDHAPETGRTRETYRGLLDPASGHGRVAARCLDEYARHFGLDPGTLARLRLLCWVIHSLSEHRHIEMAAGAAPADEELRGAVFAGLIEEELRRFQMGQQ
jgi:hypothetical protein